MNRQLTLAAMIALGSANAMAADNATEFRGIYLGQKIVDALATMEKESGFQFLPFEGIPGLPYESKIRRGMVDCGMVAFIQGELSILYLQPCYFELPNNISFADFTALMVKHYGITIDETEGQSLHRGHTQHGELITIAKIPFAPHFIAVSKVREPQF